MTNRTSMGSDYKRALGLLAQKKAGDQQKQRELKEKYAQCLQITCCACSSADTDKGYPGSGSGQPNGTSRPAPEVQPFSLDNLLPFPK